MLKQVRCMLEWEPCTLYPHLRVNPTGRQAGRQPLGQGSYKKTSCKAALSPKPPSAVTPPHGPRQGFDEEQRRAGTRNHKCGLGSIASAPQTRVRLIRSISAFPSQTKKAPSGEPWSPAAPSLASAASSLTRPKPGPAFIKGKGGKCRETEKHSWGGVRGGGGGRVLWAFHSLKDTVDLQDLIRGQGGLNQEEGGKERG